MEALDSTGVYIRLYDKGAYVPGGKLPGGYSKGKVLGKDGWPAARSGL